METTRYSELMNEETTPNKIPSVVLAAEKAASEFAVNESSDDTTRLVINVPVEWMRLAAWMYIRRQYRANGEAQPSPENPTWQIGRPPQDAHKEKAKAVMQEVMRHWFHETVSELWSGDHPILTERESASDGKGFDKVMDDEIPF